MADESLYDQWIANRQASKPSSKLTDQVIAAVEERGVQPKRCVRLADRMNQSQLVRWAACLAALLVGSLPILLVVYVSQVLVF